MFAALCNQSSLITMIGLLKKPFSICPSGLEEIQNTLSKSQWVYWGPEQGCTTLLTILTCVRLHLWWMQAFFLFLQTVLYIFPMVLMRRICFYNDYLQTIPRVLYNKICHEETQLEVVGEGNSWLKASSVKEYCRETNPQCTGAWRIAMYYWRNLRNFFGRGQIENMGLFLLMTYINVSFMWRSKTCHGWGGWKKLFVIMQ